MRNQLSFDKFIFKVPPYNNDIIPSHLQTYLFAQRNTSTIKTSLKLHHKAVNLRTYFSPNRTHHPHALMIHHKLMNLFPNNQEPPQPMKKLD